MKISECRSHGINPPDYNYQLSGLMLTFRAEVPVAAQDAEKSPQELTSGTARKTSVKSSEKSSEKILRLLEKDSQLTIDELAEKLGITTRGIEKNISKLQDARRLRCNGPAKGGHWEVLK